MCKCRTINLAGESRNFPYVSGKHKSLKTNFTCLMCSHIKRKFTFHTNKYNDVYTYLECDYCHNYIREVNYLKHVVSEFFFALDYCVIMKKDKVVLEKQGCEDITLPFFVFQDEAHLIKKIKAYTLLS